MGFLRHHWKSNLVQNLMVCVQLLPNSAKQVAAVSYLPNRHHSGGNLPIPSNHERHIFPKCQKNSFKVPVAVEKKIKNPQLELQRS